MNIKTYIYSLGIIVIIVTILSLLLPKGKVNKVIKLVLSLVVALSLFRPLLALTDDYNVYQSLNDFNVQEDFIELSRQAEIKSKTNVCKALITAIGVENPDVEIKYTTSDSNNILINKIIINLENSVIKVDKENINIKDDIKNAITTYLNVKADVVEIYE